MSLLSRIGLSLPLLIGAGCLLYTEAVNELPKLRIQGERSVVRGQKVAYSVDSNEPIVRLKWKQSALCPDSIEAARALAESGDDQPGSRNSFVVDFTEPTAETVCVTVVAQDAGGATTAAWTSIRVRTRSAAISGPRQVSRVTGSSTTFSATLIEDGRHLTDARVEWGLAATCPQTASEAAARRDEQIGSGMTLQLAAPDLVGPLCLFARFADGAQPNVPEELATLSVEAINAPPSAFVAIATPAVNATPAFHARYETVRLSVMGSDPDGDAWTPHFKIERIDDRGGAPVRTALPHEKCEDGSQDVCVAPAEAGTYEVNVDVLDTHAASAAAPPHLFIVRDTPPCLAALAPAASRIVRLLDGEGDADDDAAFAFSAERVIDDADPFPAPPRETRGRFFWFLRGPLGGALDASPPPWRDYDERGNKVSIDGRAFRSGDTFEVRVEYRDGLDVESPDPLVAPIDAAAPVGAGPGRVACAAREATCGPPSCLSRFTWKVELR